MKDPSPACNIQLITSEEVANMLCVNPGTLIAWRSIDKKMQVKQRLPFVKIGGAVRYKLQILKNLLKAGKKNE